MPAALRKLGYLGSMRFIYITAVLLAACGGSPQAATRPGAAPAGASDPKHAAPTKEEPAATAPIDCDNVCTDYAVCYEEHYKKDFRGGGDCVRNCEEMAPADRGRWALEVSAAQRDEACASLFEH
jgi:hypothetical protein